MTYSKNKKTQKSTKGFTMIEIITVIIVIGILSTIGVVSYANIQKYARDKQRINQTAIIGEALEKYYDDNGRYPTCNELRTSPTTTLRGIDEAVLTPPTATTISISCDDDEDKPADKKDVFYYSDTEIATKGTWKLTHFSEKEGGESPNFISNRRNNTTIAVNSTFALSHSAYPVDSGSITGTPVGTHNKGTTITLNAVPNVGKKFVSWSGDTCPANSQTDVQINFAMKKDINCVAKFEDEVVAIAQHTLIVSVLPAGAGTVNGDGSIDAKYDYGQSVPLTAKSTNDNKWVFSGWSDCSTSADKEISVTMDGNKICTAIFTEKKYKLTVTILPAGAGAVVGAGEYKYGEEIELKATPGVGFSSGVWSGGCTAAGVAIMNTDRSCTVTFAIKLTAPASVSVAAATSGNNTTWTPTASCTTAGSKIYYEYFYSADSGYSEGWSSTTSWTSAEYTISGTNYTRETYWQGYTYTVEIRANCTLNGISSEWATGSASYVRPFNAPSINTFNYSWRDIPETRWDWKASACSGKGPITTTYNYEFYKESDSSGGYTKNNGASSTTTDAYHIFDITGGQGYGYKVRVQARCSNSTIGTASSWGGWSNYVEYIRGIATPTATFSNVTNCNLLERIAAGGACKKMTVSTTCATGTRINYVADYYSDTYFMDPGLTKGGWYGNADDITTWAKPTWTEDISNSIKIVFALYAVDGSIVVLPKDSMVDVRIVGFCKNITTDRKSVNSAVLSSGGKVVP